jgi:hypothetical protein
MTTFNQTQLGDVLLFQGPDDGDVSVQGGVTEMTQGPESMIYIILAGPNEGDDGTEATAHLQWMGNEDEPLENQIRGRFHELLNGIPITSGTLGDLRDAAISDLTDGFGDLLEAITELTVTALSHIAVKVAGKLLLAGGATVPFALEMYKK